MNIQNLVRERIIGNIKIGTKNVNGLPQKLSNFHVEEDKGTSSEIVDIFNQLYPGKPTKLNIRFTSENPFNFKFKRYVNNKAVCIGNGTKAITIGKDSKNNNTQIEVECNENCQHRQSGKCKLKGSLKFTLDGIDAGGLWNLSTSGGISLSNIASEIVKYKKAGISIVDVPFELSLTEQQSLAYGTYYSIDLHRTDIKPKLTNNTPRLVDNTVQEVRQLNDAEKKNKSSDTKKQDEKKSKDLLQRDSKDDNLEEGTVNNTENINNEISKDSEQDFSNYLVTKKFIPTIINNTKFDKIIFEDINGQDVEYVLHPQANQDILKYGVGSIIELEKSKVESNMNILCKYKIKQIINEEGGATVFDDDGKIKKAA